MTRSALYLLMIAKEQNSVAMSNYLMDEEKIHHMHSLGISNRTLPLKFGAHSLDSWLDSFLLSELNQYFGEGALVSFGNHEVVVL